MTFVLLLLLVLLLLSTLLLSTLLLSVLMLLALLPSLLWAKPRPDEYESAAMSARRLSSAISGSCFVSSCGQSAVLRRNAIRC